MGKFFSTKANHACPTITPIDLYDVGFFKVKIAMFEASVGMITCA